MDKKENFKLFVKKNPKLVNYIKNNTMTWQKFYEIYDMYGEDKNIWKDYLDTEKKENNFDFQNFIKGIDLDGVQKGINSMQRVLGLLGDMNTSKPESPKPRPLYKHFDD